MQDRLRDFIARHVFHPLQGMTLGDWWALLRRHRFAIDPQHWPRALVQTAVSASNSVSARLERRRFGRRIDADRGPAPAVHPRALPQRHDAPAQPAGPRPAVRRPDLLPGPQPAHLPDHRAVGRPGRRPARRPAALPGRGGPGCRGAGRGRVRPRHDDRPVALPGLVLPEGRVRLRPLPDLPGRARRGGRPLGARPDHVPEEADAEARPPAGPQVAPAHRPHPAAAGPVPRRPVRPHPPAPLRGLPLDEAHDPGRPARSSASRRARCRTATTGSSASTPRCTTPTSRSGG